MSILEQGRSFKRGEVTPEEFVQATAGHNWLHHQYLWDESLFDQDNEGDCLLVEGDLIVDGPLRMTELDLVRLVVTGNLIIKGCFENVDDPEQTCFVCGNMTAHNVLTGGFLMVAGDLAVEVALVGDYNDCCAEINGKTTTKILRTEEHYFYCRGGLQVETVLGRARGEWGDSYEPEELPRPEYLRRLDPEIYTVDGECGAAFDRASWPAEDPEDMDWRISINHGQVLDFMREDKPLMLATE